MFAACKKHVSLSSLCNVFQDGDWIESKDQSETGICLIQTGNVGNGIFKDKGEKARYISEETFNRLNCTEIFEGDILVSRLPVPVGRACVMPRGLGKCITAVDCTIIRLGDKILPEYLLWFTRTPDYSMQIKKVLSGTTRLRVSRANLGNIQIPLPGIEQQSEFCKIAHQTDKSEYNVPSQFLRSAIIRWIFMSTITSFYSSSPESTVERQLADLRNIHNSYDYIKYLNNSVRRIMTDTDFTLELPNSLI